MSFIIWPEQVRSGAQVGGKAEALAALRNSGLSIPSWFVVLPNALEESIVHSGPGTFVSAPSVQSELQRAIQQLCPDNELVAVRSSALEEDGIEHSFAGQLDSFLMVRANEVAGRVADVWKSAFGPRVMAYRKLHQLRLAPVRVAVLVQRMVHAEVGGVAFGVDPTSGRKDVVVVSAVQGLGTGLVSGECNAETWRVDLSGRVIQAEIAIERPLLDESQIRAVAALVRRTGEIFARPQDIEWAWENGVLHLLQSRPVTGLPSRGKMNIWDNSNIIESYSGVTTPLTFSFARRAYEGVYRQFCHVLAVPKARIRAHDQTFCQMLGLIQGRVYYNLLNWYRVLALLPGFKLNRRFMEQMMGVKEELPEEILAELGGSSRSARLRDGLDLAFCLAALIGNHFLLARKIKRFYVRLDSALAVPATSLQTMSAEELAESFLDLEKRLLTRWDAPLLNDFFAMIFYGVLRRLAAKWTYAEQSAGQNDLLCGTGGMISAEPARRIQDLARLASENSEFVTILCEATLSAILEAMGKQPQFKSAYLEYISKFGERCLEELKLESFTLHDNPLPLLRAVGHLARSSERASQRDRADGTGPAHRQTATRLDEGFRGHPIRRAVFRWVLRNTRNRVRDRENLRFERTRLFGRVRRIFVELGQRLHARGQILESRDIFYLEIDEVIGLVNDSSAALSLKQLVAVRRQEFGIYHASPPPPNRFTTHGDDIQREQWAATPPRFFEQGELRRGIGSCPGVVHGRVRKITNPHDAVMQAGEVLVAERTDPGWITLFPSAAGLLVERGSLLSHSAIVAREMRIPTIVAIDGLMAWLEDGDQVEFDGSTGTVRRLIQVSEEIGDESPSIQPGSESRLSRRREPATSSQFVS